MTDSLFSINLGSSPSPSYGSTPSASSYSPPKFHEEEVIPGVTLENYVKREPSEDGTYVRVTKHTERVEKVKLPPPPLTPEELASKKADERFFAKLVGGVVVAGMAICALAVVIDNRRETVEELETS